MAKSPTLFYSWQSDDSATRSYVERAVKKALENISKDVTIEDAPRMDKDTQGEVGAVSITATIKRKISDSKIFLADVSLIDIGKSGKKLANQNVMFELGYALGKKTEQAVMLVANSDLGDASELPFDIAQNRIMFFNPKSDPKAEKFIASLEYAVRAHIDFVDEANRVNIRQGAKEQLISSIENQKPTQSKAESYFEDVYKRYATVAPEVSKGGELYVNIGERTVDSYQQTLPLIKEIYEVVNLAAEYGDFKPIEICYSMLGTLAVRYDQHSADEYAALVIQEIASVVIGSLAKYERWQTIGELIAMDLVKPKGGIRKYKLENTYQYPEGIKQYYNKKTGIDYAIPTTQLIQERFVDDDKILSAYVGGSLILMLALDWYYSYLSGLLLGRDSYTLEWISKLKRKDFALEFGKALGVDTLAKLRERLDQKRQQPLSDGLAYWNRDLTHIFQSENLMPINEKVGEK